MEIVKDEVTEAPKNLGEKIVGTPYDPTKQYVWTNEHVFALSGSEFGLILNAMRTTLGTREAQAILLADRANNVIEEVLKAAVERGDVKEKSAN